MKIYLDNAATTKIHPAVLEKMLPYLKDDFGNPSSIHSFGRKIKAAVEEARELIAGLINADRSEIYFMSGGTESNNFAIRGIAKTEFKESGKNRIITSHADHHCVIDTCDELKSEGITTYFAKIMNSGTLNTDDLFSSISENISLAALIHVNNETGAINDLTTITEKLKSRKIYVHTDAVQSFGKISIDVKKLGIDSLAASSHKIHGPKGVGFAFIKNGTPITSLISGGSQERNLRGGTENVSGIIGFAEAAKIAHINMEKNREHVFDLKSRMIQGLRRIDNTYITINSEENASPYILSVTFLPEKYITDSEAMIMYLDINGVAASAGAACSSGAIKPSHVMLSMGKTRQEAAGTIRFSFSPINKSEEIAAALEIIEKMTIKFSR